MVVVLAAAAAAAVAQGGVVVVAVEQAGRSSSRSVSASSDTHACCEVLRCAVPRRVSASPPLSRAQASSWSERCHATNTLVLFS